MGRATSTPPLATTVAGSNIAGHRCSWSSLQWPQTIHHGTESAPIDEPGRQLVSIPPLIRDSSVPDSVQGRSIRPLPTNPAFEVPANTFFLHRNCKPLKLYITNKFHHGFSRFRPQLLRWLVSKTSSTIIDPSKG